MEIEYHLSNNKDSLEVLGTEHSKLNGVKQEVALSILCFSLYMSIFFR